MAFLRGGSALGFPWRPLGPALVVNVLVSFQREHLALLILRVLRRQLQVPVAHLPQVDRLLLHVLRSFGAAPRDALATDIIDLLLGIVLELAALPMIHAALCDLPAT